MAAADDADGAVGKLPAHGLTPGAVQHLGVGGGHVTEQRNGERDHQFGDRAPVDPAGPAQLDAAFDQRVQVDPVETDTVLGDNLQFRHGVEHRTVDPFQRDHRLVVTFQEIDQAIPGQAFAGVVERCIGIAGL